MCTELASSLSDCRPSQILVADNFDLQSLRRGLLPCLCSRNAGYVAVEVTCSLEERPCRNERRSGVVLDRRDSDRHAEPL